MTYAKKYFILILLFTFLTFSLTGCYNSQNIDELAYVVAIGLDVGDSNNLKLSLQLAKPSSSSSEGSSQSASSVVNSIECSSIDSGISLFNSYISKKINLSHCKVIVLSEQLAQNGISQYLYTFMNNIQVSPHANIIISKCSSKDFLNSSEPILEQLSARYYEIAPTSSEYTGYTADVTLGNFFNAYTDTFQEPYAILGSINTPNTQQANQNPISDPSATNQDSVYLAGETPIDSSDNIENMGLAVFSGDKIVGELTGLESICHMIISNQLKSCNIQIPDPLRENTFIDLNLKLSKKTKNKVHLINGFPYIDSTVKVEARILSMNYNSHNLDNHSVTMIEDYCNSYLKTILTEYLYKTAKSLHSDIDGFGKYAIKYFPTWKDWIEYNWLYNYRNSFFKVTVTTDLKSGYTLMET